MLIDDRDWTQYFVAFIEFNILIPRSLPGAIKKKNKKKKKKKEKERERKEKIKIKPWQTQISQHHIYK